MPHDLLLVLAGGGIITALLKFIEYLIGHFTHKQERKEDREDNDLREELKQHLDNVNANWKEKYCDVNSKMIQDLTKEMREGLEAREEKGAERYKPEGRGGTYLRPAGNQRGRKIHPAADHQRDHPAGKWIRGSQRGRGMGKPRGEGADLLPDG